MHGHPRNHLAPMSVMAEARLKVSLVTDCRVWRLQISLWHKASDSLTKGTFVQRKAAYSCRDCESQSDKPVGGTFLETDTMIKHFVKMACIYVAKYRNIACEGCMGLVYVFNGCEIKLCLCLEQSWQAEINQSERYAWAGFVCQHQCKNYK